MDVGSFVMGVACGVLSAGCMSVVLLRRLDARIDRIAYIQRSVLKGCVAFGVELNRYTHDPDEIERRSEAFLDDVLREHADTRPTSS